MLKLIFHFVLKKIASEGAADAALSDVGTPFLGLT
jgi:hypothetical protein